MSVTNTKHPQSRYSLKALRNELLLFQEESRFFQRLLRRSAKPAHQDQLLNRLQQFQQETLPYLQRALRTLEGQSSNITRADNGRSHISLFVEGLESARLQITQLKREALRELNKQGLPLSIW